MPDGCFVGGHVQQSRRFVGEVEPEVGCRQFAIEGEGLAVERREDRIEGVLHDAGVRARGARGEPSRSTSVTRAPAPARNAAADVPTMPPPTTMTSWRRGHVGLSMPADDGASLLVRFTREGNGREPPLDMAPTATVHNRAGRLGRNVVERAIRAPAGHGGPDRCVRSRHRVAGAVRRSRILGVSNQGRRIDRDRRPDRDCQRDIDDDRRTRPLRRLPPRLPSRPAAGSRPAGRRSAVGCRRSRASVTGASWSSATNRSYCVREDSVPDGDLAAGETATGPQGPSLNKPRAGRRTRLGRRRQGAGDGWRERRHAGSRRAADSPSGLLQHLHLRSCRCRRGVVPGRPPRDGARGRGGGDAAMTDASSSSAATTSMARSTHGGEAPASSWRPRESRSGGASPGDIRLTDVDVPQVVPALATAEVYDPATDTWSATGPMRYARFGAAAVTLADGRVLDRRVARARMTRRAGTTSDVRIDERARETYEMYDPRTGAFSLGQLPRPRIGRRSRTSAAIEWTKD